MQKLSALQALPEIAMAEAAMAEADMAYN